MWLRRGFDIWTTSRIMKNRKIIHDNWETPNYLLDMIRKEFGSFYDPCPLNADFDGLKSDWKAVNYINPPYNLKYKTLFVKKAITESLQGKICILLLPVTTETQCFKELWNYANEIRFLYKRVCFKGLNSKGEYVKDKTGQGGSMLVIMNGCWTTSPPKVSLMQHK